MNKTIVLLKEHTHGGRKHQRGALLAIDSRAADWLIEQGVAMEKAGAKAPPAKAVTRRGCCGGRW